MTDQPTDSGEEGSDRSYVYHLEFVPRDIRNMENPKKIGQIAFLDLLFDHSAIDAGLQKQPFLQVYESMITSRNK